jgi:hypothetical protein
MNWTGVTTRKNEGWHSAADGRVLRNRDLSTIMVQITLESLCIMFKCLACLVWAVVMSFAVVSIDCLATGLQTAQQTSSNIHPTSSSTPVEQASMWRDPSPHRIRFVQVEENVKLEVLDWGGTGCSLVLLAGLGHTAHIYDDIAPMTTGYYVPKAAEEATREGVAAWQQMQQCLRELAELNKERNLQRAREADSQ